MENERNLPMHSNGSQRSLETMDNELSLSLDDLLKVIKRGWILMLIAPILAGALAFWYVTSTHVDEYVASVKLYTLFDYVDNTGTTRYDTGLTNYFINDYKEMIQAPEVMQETCYRLGWASRPAGMSVSVKPVEGTRFITVNVRARDPQVCMDAANMLAQVFSEYVRNMLGRDSVRIAAQATLPGAPINTGDMGKVTTAALAAFALVTGVMVLLQMMNTKVRANTDADIRFKTNVLSNIYGYKKDMDAYLDKKKSKDSDLLSCVNEHTRESIKKLALNLQFAAMGEPLRTLTITSTTPKEGKSSVGLMLGCELANQGKRVLIADMDYRSPMIGRYLGKRNKADILDYMGGMQLSEVVSPTNVPNLYFMDSKHKMAVNTSLEAFDRFLEECRNYFDLVIFDTAPLGMFVDAAFLAAKSDGTLVIVKDEHVDRKELMKLLVQLDQVNARLLGIAFNQVNYKGSGHYYYNYRYYHYGEHHNEDGSRKGKKHSRKHEAEA